MPSTFESFQEANISNIQSDDFVVGYDTAVLGGERRYTIDTIANKSFQIIQPQLYTTIGAPYGLFRKSDPSVVAWSKTGNFTVSTAVTIYAEVNGNYVQINAGTPIAMPSSPTTGTDYAIWLNPDGTLHSTDNFISGPAAGSRRLGGFHYAIGSNAPSFNSGGDRTPQINEYSFWDLKFRPNCPDPRGMTLVCNSFWVDIYLCGIDHIVNGTSKYNVQMALTTVKKPIEFGGDGTIEYLNQYNNNVHGWHSSHEVLISHGKRGLSYQEFCASAFGVIEERMYWGGLIGSSRITGSDGPLNTEQEQYYNTFNIYTSKWGVIQASIPTWGDLYIPRTMPNLYTLDRGGVAFENTTLNGYWSLFSGSQSSQMVDYFIGAPSPFQAPATRGASDHIAID